MNLLSRYEVLPSLLAGADAWQAVAADFRGSMVHGVDGEPGSVRISVEDGAVSVGPADGEGDSLVIHGPAEVWEAIFAGQRDPIRSLTLGELVMDATAKEVVRQMAVITVLFAVLATLDHSTQGVAQ